MFSGSLIRSGNNAKTVKGDGEFETAILYMAPASSVDGVNVCSMATIAACAKACLYTAGRGAYSNVQKARMDKTRRYRDNRAQFLRDLVRDLEAFERYCQRKGVKPAVRLNGTSDIGWEVGHPVTRDGVRFDHVFVAFPGIMFYDYTKVTKRTLRDLPANYSLVLSYSEANARYTDMVTDAATRSGANVAVVFRDKATREKYMATGFMGRAVIDGDRDDLRFKDPAGVVVGLYAKGSAKGDRTGFVID